MFYCIFSVWHRLSHTIKEYAYKIGQFEVTFAETKKAMSDPIMTKAWEITRKNITGTDFGLRGFKLTLDELHFRWLNIKGFLLRFLFR